MNREEIAARLGEVGYIADRDLSTALRLMEFLKRPLLLEGEAEVGKTEVAKSLGAVRKAELIRLHCYERLDQNAALQAPAGLDLDAITPEEIALSILAEIVMVRRKRQRAEAEA